MNDTDELLNVVVIDHSFLHQIGWARHFANTTSGFNVILATDKRPSGRDGKLEIINVNDSPLVTSLEDIQQRLGFSIYKALVPERAYFDYTSLDKRQCYSRLTLEEVGRRVNSYIDTLDRLIRDRAGVVLGHLADNGIASVAALLAENYGKPYMAALPYYWWADRFIVCDRPDQTSSQVDYLYGLYYRQELPIDRKEIDSIFSSKRTGLSYSDNQVYRLRDRLRKISNSKSWHEPFSLRNWLARRSHYLLSAVSIRLFAKLRKKHSSERPFLLFPLHVVPEASLLGASPELADQLSIIKNISINLPWGVDLYVKRHPGQKNWFGPDFNFFKRLQALPNVQIIDTTVPVEEMLDDPNCLAVATINGTVGLEAAIKRIPVFVFGRAIYGVADCFLNPQSFSDFEKKVLEIFQGRYQFNEKALYAILAALNASGWTGRGDFLASKTAREFALGCGVVYEKYINARPWRRRYACVGDQLSGGKDGESE